MATRPLTDRERRTLRYGGIGIALYLVLFFGIKAWRFAEGRRSGYRRLVVEAAAWDSKLAVYDEKVKLAGDLMERFRMDPGRLSRTSLVAQASAAIQQAALQGGVQLGPVRETPSRAASRELTGIQLEGMGPVPSVLTFMEALGTLGFPVVTDSIQMSPAPGGPAQVKVSVSLLLLDFEQWKPAERRPDA
ncbi:MAG: hypothetical protein AB7O66_05205 [Limisphaerales bacterium]